LVDQAGRNLDWAIGPITIRDEDVVVVTFAVTNLSYTDAPTQTEQELKITGAWLNTVAGGLAIGGAATGPGVGAFETAAAVFAAVGSVMEFIGEAFHWLGLGGQTNCNGPVLISPPIAFTGAQLQELDYKAVPVWPGNVIEEVHTFTNRNLEQASQSGCGHPPDTDVYWSVVRDLSRVDRFGGGPPPPPLPLQPIAASLLSQNWNGIWGDAFYVEDSRIVCFISSDGGEVVLSARLNLPLSERVGAHMQVLHQKLTTVPAFLSLMVSDARTTRSGPLTLPSTSAVGAIPSHKAQITEHFGSPSGRVATQLEIDRLIEITMRATPFVKDVYPPTPLPGVAFTGGVAVEVESTVRATEATAARVPTHTLGGAVVSGEAASQAAMGVPAHPPGPPRSLQGLWRWCHKCQGMFFGGNPSKGVCPADGQPHDPSQSGHYAALLGEDAPGQQGAWRWCHKCQGMFFGGNPSKGVCPADRQPHDPSQSGHYAVLFATSEPAAEPTVFAATLVASDEICLQLYGGFDSAGRIVNHRVRYLRTTKAGDTLTDVMLAPAQRRPT